ncbi:MAG: hypothetical protein EA411_01005 [Saprospirales bacterium]|nr:MAG: hypothetical protein EA411_01005 [Saprospirales bacterium]
MDKFPGKPSQISQIIYLYTMDPLSILLTIVKLTLPAAVVFATAYTILKNFLDKQYQMKLLEVKNDNRKTTIPLKFQAYERLALLCERISPGNLILRIKSPGMTVEDFHMALLIAIQQEFDHNISQQVYVSDNLWNIIKYTRQHLINTITACAAELDKREPAEKLSELLMENFDEMEEKPLETAQKAIRREASVLM